VTRGEDLLDTTQRRRRPQRSVADPRGALLRIGLVDRAPVRPFARLARARQEIAKRVDALRQAPRWSPAALTPLLTPGARGVRAPGGRGLRALLADAAPHLPFAHVATRDAGMLPARAELLAEVEMVRAGRWSIFGQDVAVGPTIDWTAHPLTGARAPARHWHEVPYIDGLGADVKHLWELNRHLPILRLAQGYRVTGDETLAEQAVSLIASWMTQNPPRYGINWGSSLEVSFRAITWCWVWTLTRDARCWTEPLVEQFLWQLWHHARHIERFDSIHHSPNTHLTGEVVGLVYIGSCFPVLARSGEWRRRGESILTSELAYQVLADGMHFERATGYHRYTVEFYLHHLLLARSAGRPVPAALEASLRMQLEVAAQTRRADHRWPVIGDEDGGDMVRLGPTPANDQRPLLAAGAALFGRPDWLYGATDEARAASWWLLDDLSWTTLAAMRPAMPVALSASLASAGYFVGRESWRDDAWFCLVDAGPHGGGMTGHAHTDLGHVEISRGGVPIVADPGCPSYTVSTADRDWFRSEMAHACLVVDGAPLAMPRGAFSWTRVSPTPDVAGGDDGTLWWCELSYVRDGRSGAVRHRRQVVLVRGAGIVVADWVAPQGREAIAVHWPLAGAAWEMRDDGVVGYGASIHWATPDASPATTSRASLTESRYSPTYGETREGRLLILRYDGATPSAIVTAFGAADAALRLAASGDELAITLGSDASYRLAIAPGRAPAMRQLDRAAAAARQPVTGGTR
jgi:heparinase II/III-like protein